MTAKLCRVSEIGAIVILAALVPEGLQAQSVDATAQPGEWVYTVRPRDTLWALGRTHLIHPADWTHLQRLNRLSSDRLVPGMRLRIPFDLMRLRPAPARVVETRGRADVLRTGGQRAPLAIDRQLYAGDVVETGPDGSASVAFADESTMLIGTNARVVFDLLANFGTTGMVDTRLRVDRGRVRPNVVPRRGRFQIWSPALQITTRGTEFRVESAADGASRVEVTDNAVDATNAGATVLVPQGTGTLARAGGAPTPPVALLAAPGLGTPVPPLRRVPFRLTIPPAAGAAGYHWEVSASGAFQSLVVDTTSTQPTVQLPDVPDGIYAFRVRAIDAQGLEGFDANGQFEIDARPEAPFLMAPAPAAVVRVERPPLTWTQPTDAAGFRVQISRDDLGSLLVDGPAMPGRAFIPDTALGPGTYVWRVATRLADGEEGPFGDAQTFTVRLPPESPTADPPALDVDSLALRWPASSGTGIRYQAQLARDVGFAAVESEHTVSEPQLTLPRPAPGTYYLRVRAIDTDGFEGAFGTTQAFTVPAAGVVEPRARRRRWLLLLPPVVVTGLAILLL